MRQNGARSFSIAICILVIASTLIVTTGCSSNGSTTAITSSTTTTTQTLTTTPVTVPTTKPVSTTTVSTTNSKPAPVYGGTLTVFTNWAYADPTGWDHPMAINLSAGAVWGNPYLEWLIVGDIDKYGPAGTNEFSFKLFEAVPEQYMTGLLAESWEVSVDPVLTYTWHLRKGIMWTGNQKIGMASRELVSSDVVTAEQRAVARPGFAGSFAWLTSISATDKYTVIWKCSSFYALWSWRMGGTALGQIWAPETITAGPTDWRNHVGTGPFILSDYVAGSGATYTRNPNYWGKTTINGKEYQEPFLDKLIYPIIPDESTQVAASRTGKVDWNPKMKLLYQTTLASTQGLVLDKYLSGVTDIIKFNRLTSKIGGDLKLRRALMIGTDLQSIAKLVYSGGEYYSFPVAPGAAGFVPLDQLPVSQKSLWTFDAAKAKQLIADAGYPSGFTMQLDIGTNQTMQDLGNALAGMWAKFGVTLNLKVIDQTALSTEYNDVSYKDAMIYGITVANPLTSLQMSRSTVAGAIYRKTGEPVDFETMYLAASSTVDPIQRAAAIKTLSVAFMDDAGCIGLANPYVLNCYWSWMRNYNGEVDAIYYNQIPMIKKMWIDTNLKNSLGK